MPFSHGETENNMHNMLLVGGEQGSVGVARGDIRLGAKRAESGRSHL